MNRSALTLGLLGFVAVMIFVVVRSKSPNVNTVGDVTSTTNVGSLLDDGLDALLSGIKSLGNGSGGSGGYTGTGRIFSFLGPANARYDVSIDAIAQVFNVPPGYQPSVGIRP